ncbi:TIGR03943 family putative permease subunit [Streptosporangium carneum]|uniref:TIGR03943 family putative permease subunit n=1 Tax=Streptosporangium carneum TaxID=47481 RepID=UPI0022F30EBD|nr:TIGR03943 family protein [Streptosporangium carneum]
MTQNLLLTMLGCAVLRISAFSSTYLNYVKPGFRPFLIAAGAVLVVLGLAGLLQAFRSRGSSGQEEPRDHGDHGGHRDHGGPGDHEGHEEHEGHGDHGDHGGHGHDHSRGPRVAWLMFLPVFAIFLVAPPALGSFAAARSDTPPPRGQALSSFTPLTGKGPVDMPIGEFIGRAWDDGERSLTGREVRLTGFVVPSKRKGQWYVTRMQIACCAADAFPLKVAVKGLQAPPENAWVEVVGTWIPQTFGEMPNGVVYPELAGTDLARVDAPAEPYE